MKVWDTGWNGNEWFVIGVTLAGAALVFFLPRRFSKSSTILYLLFGAYFGVLFDHTLAGEPFELYDVNDTSMLEITDVATYVMYSPFSYLFIYIYDWLRLPHRLAPIYILVWSAFGMALEGVGTQIGVFHYKGGYVFDFSSLIYLFLQVCTLGLYYYVKNQERGSDMRKCPQPQESS